MSPVEAMARALDRFGWFAEPCLLENYPGQAEIVRNELRFAAVAALRALRENVSERMVEAAYEARSWDDCWQIHDGSDFSKAFEAALLAAEEPT